MLLVDAEGGFCIQTWRSKRSPPSLSAS